jgi:hypothetical protein
MEFFRSLRSPILSIGSIGPAEAVPLLQSPPTEFFIKL